jgi:hypothetical protein
VFHIFRKLVQTFTCIWTLLLYPYNRLMLRFLQLTMFFVMFVMRTI